MSQYLADKVIIVTGAGSGFGRLIAHRCATGGARVVGVDVNADVGADSDADAGSNARTSGGAHCAARCARWRGAQFA